MANISDNRSNRAIASPPIKPHEIVFVWLCVMLFWDCVMNYFDRGITNIIFLKWPCIVLTVIFLSKSFARRENLDFAAIMGRGIEPRSYIELAGVLTTCIFIGIGCWAVLVLLSAKIDLDWAYGYWNFAPPSAFAENSWLPGWVFLQAIVVGLIAPVTEEIVFRGFVLRRLREKHSVGGAIIFTSLIFGLVHLNQSFVGSFLHGIVYALLAIRFASLYAPIFVHGAYNCVIFFVERAYGFSLIAEKSRIASFDYWLPELALMTLGMISLAWYWKRCFNVHEQSVPTCVQAEYVS